MALPPNTPVIVGVGFEQVTSPDPRECPEAVGLMERAVRRAAEDAAPAAVAPRLLAELESISVPQGMWQYRNPGRLLAEALGCRSARSIIADLGVLQLTLLSELCRAIASGEQQLGVVTGGEAQFRELRSMITQTPVTETAQPEDTPPPDVHHTSPDPFCSDLEGQRGLQTPVELFSIIESALRHHEGLGIDAHRDRVARLYQGFSEVAARNPNAWRREPVKAEELRDPSPKNPMVAFPYTKRLCSQWNVNRAVAIVVASAAKAEALGLDRARWIFPVSATQSRHVVVLAQQRRLYSHPGTVRSGERALALAGIARDALLAAELYSCFPAAMRSFALDLGLDGVCPLTVTGSMTFAGGPFNSASLEGVARMVEVLREPREEKTPAGRFGLVSNLSGIFGKQACTILANVPNGDGYGFEDVTDVVAREDVPVPLDETYEGPATVAGYTVSFRQGEPAYAVAIGDTPGGQRTVARSDDRSRLETMMREELCGRTIDVRSGGVF